MQLGTIFLPGQTRKLWHWPWETSETKEEHKQDFQNERNPSTPAGVQKIFQKGQQWRRSKYLVRHSPTLLPKRSAGGNVLCLGAEWGAPGAGRCLQWWGRCWGPWAWDHALSQSGTRLHRRTGLHAERLDSAKVACILEATVSIYNHFNYSHCNIIEEEDRLHIPMCTPQCGHQPFPCRSAAIWVVWLWWTTWGRSCSLLSSSNSYPGGSGPVTQGGFLTCQLCFKCLLHGWSILSLSIKWSTQLQVKSDPCGLSHSGFDQKYLWAISVTWEHIVCKISPTKQPRIVGNTSVTGVLVPASTHWPRDCTQESSGVPTSTSISLLSPALTVAPGKLVFVWVPLCA